MNPLSIPKKQCGLPIKEAVKRYPSLRQYITNRNNHIDLGNSQALLLYNRLILQDFLSLDFTIPPDFLVPTVCSRWAFISWIANDSPSIVLEIGTGASAILALILAKIGCFVEATEINEIAHKSALSNIRCNGLESKIVLIKINDRDRILPDKIGSLNRFDAIVCNPPQYDQDYYNQRRSYKKGFVGQESELVGGKEGYEFIIKLIEEINDFSNPPSFYFQLTVPKLSKVIDSYLRERNRSFIMDTITLGTRQRYYYKINY
ncbi:MAG: RlmF-related methyltransferase, partial [Promethearchaeota archaeon]